MIVPDVLEGHIGVTGKLDACTLPSHGDVIACFRKAWNPQRMLIAPIEFHAEAPVACAVAGMAPDLPSGEYFAGGIVEHNLPICAGVLVPATCRAHADRPSSVSCGSAFEPGCCSPGTEHALWGKVCLTEDNLPLCAGFLIGVQVFSRSEALQQLLALPQARMVCTA